MRTSSPSRGTQRCSLPSLGKWAHQLWAGSGLGKHKGDSRVLGEDRVHARNLSPMFKWSLAITGGFCVRPCPVCSHRHRQGVCTDSLAQQEPSFNPVQPCWGSSAQMQKEANFRGSLSFCSCRSLLCSMGQPPGWMPGGSSTTCASHASRDLWSLFRPLIYIYVWQEAHGPILLGGLGFSLS